MLTYLFEKYNSLKSEYMNRSPKGKWRFVLNMAIFAQSLYGVAVVDRDFKLWWYSYLSGVTFLEVACSIVYTCWYYIEEPIKGALLISMIGVLVPVK